MKYFLIILLLFFSNKLFAKDLIFNVGVSAFYANINNPKYDFVNEYELVKDPLSSIRSINVGVIKPIDKFNIGISTNRLFNSSINRNVIDKRNNKILQNKSKFINDVMSFGYNVGKFNPAVLITNSRLEQTLCYNNICNSKKNNAILYGASLSYLLKRNVSVSALYIAPNREFDLESAFGFNINYLF